MTKDDRIDILRMREADLRHSNDRKMAEIREMRELLGRLIEEVQMPADILNDCVRYKRGVHL